MLVSDAELKTLLLSSKVASEELIDRLIGLAKDSHMSLREIVVEKGIVSDQDLGKITAEFLKIPFVDLSKIVIPEDVFNIIPERIARKYKVVSFALDDRNIKLGMVDPNKEIAEIVAKKVSKDPEIYFATEADINAIFQMYSRDLQKVVDELVKEEVENINNLTNDAPIIKIVDRIITHAYHEKASDIHIEPEEENVLVRFRIDGILHDVLRVKKNLHSSIITRIKVLSRLRTDEHFDAQDGKIRFKIDEENLDIRVSVIPTTDGEKAVLRLLSSRFRSFSLVDLGMKEDDLNKVNSAAEKSYGMILSTGATGSGKTTSIYSILKIINTREKNITTIEDPVEYRIRGVNHIPVNSKTSLNFANGLRSILRQDPNIIFVGEIRDSETAGLAVNAALTGHLVFSTLHTNDAATAIPRLIDMKVEPFLLSSTINMVIAQRLIRKICLNCKVEVFTKKNDLSKNIPLKTLEKYFGKKDKLLTYRGKGCKVCHQTGYFGRIGIFEVLEISEKIKKLILARNDSSSIRTTAIEEGMTTLLDDGLLKVINGTTTIEEVIRIIKVEPIK